MKLASAVLAFLLTLCGNYTTSKAETKDHEKKKPTTRISTTAVGREVPKAPPVVAALPPAPAPVSGLQKLPVGPPPESGVVDLGTQAELIVTAAHSREWSVVVGLVIMLLIWLLGFFWTALPNAYLPTIAVCVGVVASVGAELTVGGVWWKAILSGLTTGTAATGLWELLGKKLFGSRKNARARAKAAPKK
jgi:hypothetical protein